MRTEGASLLGKLASIVGALQLGACAQIVGIEEWGTGGAAAGSTSAVTGSSSSGGDTCSGTCAPPVDTGWRGPVSLHVSPKGAPSGCSNSTLTVYEGSSGLVAASYCDGCACRGKTTNCNSVTFAWATAGTCGQEFELTAAGCTALIPSAMADAVTTLYDTIGIGNPPSCEIDPSTPLAPHPFAWTEALVACAAPIDASCGDAGACFPPPTAQTSQKQYVCMYKSGDEACPGTSVYLDKHVAFGGASDTRTCQCDCNGAATSVECNGSVKAYASNNCSGAAVASFPLNPDKCNAVPAVNFSSVAYEPINLGNCAAPINSVTGTVTGTDPTTFCCVLNAP